MVWKLHCLPCRASSDCGPMLSPICPLLEYMMFSYHLQCGTLYRFSPHVQSDLFCNDFHSGSGRRVSGMKLQCAFSGRIFQSHSSNWDLVFSLLHTQLLLTKCFFHASIWLTPGDRLLHHSGEKKICSTRTPFLSNARLDFRCGSSMVSFHRVSFPSSIMGHFNHGHDGRQPWWSQGFPVPHGHRSIGSRSFLMIVKHNKCLKLWDGWKTVSHVSLDRQHIDWHSHWTLLHFLWSHQHLGGNMIRTSQAALLENVMGIKTEKVFPKLMKMLRNNLPQKLSCQKT